MHFPFLKEIIATESKVNKFMNVIGNLLPASSNCLKMIFQKTRKYNLSRFSLKVGKSVSMYKTAITKCINTTELHKSIRYCCTFTKQIAID